MPTVIKIFLRAEGASPWITLSCLLLASITEGIGFATLLPLLAIATGGNSEDDSTLFNVIREVFDGLGLALEIGPLLVFVVVAITLKSALNMAAMYHVGRAVAEITTRLRRRFITLLVDARWDFIVTQSGGKLTNALMGQTLSTGRAYEAASRFMASFVQTVILFALALIVSFKVTLVGCAVGAVIMVLLHYFVRRSRKTGRKETTWQREIGVAWHNTLAALKPLKAMERQYEFFNRFEKLLLEWRKAAAKQVFFREARTNVQDVLFALILGLGAYLALVVWSVPIAELLVVGFILLRAVRGLGKLQQQYQTSVALEYPFIELSETLQEIEQAKEEWRGSDPCPALTHGIVVDNLSYSHGPDRVLTNASFVIPPRGVTVMTGPSGAGKTTTADLILGLYRPAQGRILVDKHSLDAIDLSEWRRSIGYVPQDPVMFNGSVLDNIQLFDSRISQDDIVWALKTARAWNFVNDMSNGLKSLIGDRGETLSGGQRQRLALARALVVRPKLLILDEVTSALDPENEQLIVEALDELSKSMAILAITHRPAILDIATRRYDVRDGMVVPMAPGSEDDHHHSKEPAIAVS